MESKESEQTSNHSYDISSGAQDVKFLTSQQHQQQLVTIRACVQESPYSIENWLKLLTLLPPDERLAALNTFRDASSDTILHYCARQEVDLTPFKCVLETLPAPQRWEALSSIENGSHQTVLHVVAIHNSVLLLYLLESQPYNLLWSALQGKNQHPTILDGAFRDRHSWPSEVLKFLLSLPPVLQQAIETTDDLKAADHFENNLTQLHLCFNTNRAMRNRYHGPRARWRIFNRLHGSYLSDSADVDPAEVKVAVAALTSKYRELEMLAICMQPGDSEFKQKIAELNQCADKLKEVILTHSLPLRITLAIGRLVGAIIGGIIAFVIGFVIGAVLIVGTIAPPLLFWPLLTPQGHLAIAIAIIVTGLLFGIVNSISGVKEGACYGEQFAYKTYKAVERGLFSKPHQTESYELVELARANAQSVQEELGQEQSNLSRWH